MRTYRYIGPKAIAERNRNAPPGTRITSAADVINWLNDSDREFSADGSIVATFVVDLGGILRISDRRSEHVACAAGEPVRSAGEITFQIDDGAVDVASVSNQSTGYCPEPESWPAVAEALRAAGFDPPSEFELACEFRLCPPCRNRNLIKAGDFTCAVCGSALPAEYNCQ